MKHLLLAASTTALVFLSQFGTSCTGNGNANDSIDSTKDEVRSLIIGSDTLLNLKFNLSDFYSNPNYNIDIDNMPFEELRLLRSVPYAKHGHWFKEGEINEKFCSVKKYIEDLKPVVKAYAQDELKKKKSEYWQNWDKCYSKTYTMIQLTPEEAAFVKRVDQKIAELKKTKANETDGAKMANLQLLENASYIEIGDHTFWDNINKYNFAISQDGYSQMFNPYELSDYDFMPNYVTTDLYLHTYHMYFSWVLKMLETKEFLPSMNKMANNLYKQSLNEITAANTAEEKDLAEYAATYYAIAVKLGTGRDVDFIPEAYEEQYKVEVGNIMAQADGPSDFLGIVDNFPYSLFKPRGHYNRSKEAQQYFRCMMWLQSAWFCLEKPESFQKALYLAKQFKGANAETKRLCHATNNAITFLMGQPDNIPVLEIANLLGKEIDINANEDLFNTGKMEKAAGVILKKFAEFNKIKPKQPALMACENKINFMPQRYVPDNEVLAQMYDENPNSNRPYPCGLDVFDAFGSKIAANILDSTDNGAKQWKDYGKFRTLVRNKFTKFKDFDKTMYNKWFECLVTLQKKEKSAPGHMQTGAWDRKSMNTTLASWAQLKHDAILYAEQPSGAECGDGMLESIILPAPEYVQHYVEPNIAFWKKLKDMLDLNVVMLKKAGFYNNTIAEKTNFLMNEVSFCINISEKELKNIKLTTEENDKLSATGSGFESYTLQIINPDIQYEGWWQVKGSDTTVSVIADVFTRNIPMCEKNGILHEAVGKANTIYVVVERNGHTYLTRGAVFDYREFIAPAGTRYTDQEWQREIVDKSNTKGRPSWMTDLYTKRNVKINKTAAKREYPFWALEWNNESLQLAPDSLYLSNYDTYSY